MLTVENLCLSYSKKTPVIQEVCFSVKEKELLGIIGPNGAGKTSLLKAIVGLKKIDSGNIKLFGGPIQKSLTKISYVPQRQSIDWDFPITVGEVALMGRYGKLGLLKRPSKQDYAIARQSIERVGLENFFDAPISELSGGQQQRTFLARALAQESELYFMDEPFAGLDLATERAIIDILKDLCSEGKSILVVHHDLSTVDKYFNRVLLINKKIHACGPTQEVFTSENLQKTYEGKLLTLKNK